MGSLSGNCGGDPSPVLDGLRQALRRSGMSGPGFPAGPEPAVALGMSAVDAVLGGGLARAALHEIAPAAPVHLAAAAGLSAALAVLASGGRGRANGARQVLQLKPCG